MKARVLTGALICQCLWAAAASAEQAFRIAPLGGFEWSFIDQVVALDPTGMLSRPDMDATPDADTGPEILVALHSDWEAADARLSRMRQPFSDWLDPLPDPTTTVQRTDFTRDNGSTVRIYNFVTHVDGTAVPQDCQAAFIVADFAQPAPFVPFTLADCDDELS